MKRRTQQSSIGSAARAILGGAIAIAVVSLVLPLSHFGLAAATFDEATRTWSSLGNALIGLDVTMVRQNAFVLLREAEWSVAIIDHGATRTSIGFGLYNFISRGRMATIKDALAFYGVPLTTRQRRLVNPCKPLSELGTDRSITIQSDPWQHGVASWYGPGFQGQLAASGDIYNMYERTAAHKTLPLGSIVRVVAQRTGASTIVRINDRGPYIPGRIIDLSYSAKEALGVGDVAAVYLERIDPTALDAPCGI